MLRSSTSHTRHVTPCEGAGWASVGGRTRGRLCLGEVSNQSEMRRRFLWGCVQQSHHSSKGRVLEALNSETGGLDFYLQATEFYLYKNFICYKNNRFLSVFPNEWDKEDWRLFSRVTALIITMATFYYALLYVRHCSSSFT